MARSVYFSALLSVAVFSAPSSALVISTNASDGVVSSGFCSSTTNALFDSCTDNGTDSAGTSSTTASGNALRGELKARTMSTRFDFLGRPNGVGSASATIRETFTVFGSGTIRASLILEGAWDLVPSTALQTTGYDIFAYVRPLEPSTGSLTDITDLEFGEFARQANNGGRSASDDPMSGQVAEVLYREFSVASGTIFDIEWFLGINQQLANGTIDFGNTGLLEIQTSEGVSIAAANPRFLSEQAVSVPAPASILLVMIGAVLIGPSARRKRVL